MQVVCFDRMFWATTFTARARAQYECSATAFYADDVCLKDAKAEAIICLKTEMS